ncbi:MAG: TonB-dependent receptor [Novosphingobium sp.]|nr:MAG: TonB-dependent receptor [Novosphingobium sp.]
MRPTFSSDPRAWLLAGAALSAIFGATAVSAAELSDSATAAAITSADLAETAGAEAEAGNATVGLESIVVTAQKRETNLQETPIAISVLGGGDLKNRRVQSLLDLIDGSVPSLRIAPFFSRQSAVSVGIRGIVPSDANQPSRDQGVGVYLDGVILGRSQGLGAALFDIERIEVLKGPQGTLFGRNSTGGAVSIVTREPSGKFGLRATAGVGNYGAHRVEAHLDLPSWNNIAVKIDGVLTKRDGTVKNTLEGEDDFNAYDRRGLHLGAKWEPSDSFSARYDFDISQDRTTPIYVQLIDRHPSAPAANFAPLVQVQARRTDVVDVGLPQQESVGNIHGHMLRLSWHPADDIEVRSISAYRKLDQSQFDNSIGAHSGRFVPNAQFARYSLASLRQEQFSQELQVLGKFDSLEFVGGVFYYHEKGDDDAWSPNTMQWNATGTAATRLPTLAAGAATVFPDRASTAKTDSIAVFGQATWTPPVLDERLHLTVGGRYTSDKKEGALTKVNGAVPVLNGVTGNIPFKGKWDRFDPMVTLAFDPTDAVHVYGRWGTAYRAGGANSRSLTYRAFDPETVSTIEGGIKAELLDRRVRLNLAAYHTSFKDIQIDFNAVNLGGSNRTTIETVNAAGKGTIDGFEADLTIAPVEGLTLTGSYAYTKSKLPPADNPFDTSTALVPSYVVFTPKNALSTAIDYELPLGGATLRFHLDGNFADGYRVASGTDVLSDPSTIFNGRISLGDIELGRGATFEVAVWGRNLFNEDHLFYRGGPNPTLGSFGMFNDPRTYGVDATVRF